MHSSSVKSYRHCADLGRAQSLNRRAPPDRPDSDTLHTKYTSYPTQPDRDTVQTGYLVRPAISGCSATMSLLESISSQIARCNDNFPRHSTVMPKSNIGNYGRLLLHSSPSRLGDLVINLTVAATIFWTLILIFEALSGQRLHEYRRRREPLTLEPRASLVADLIQHVETADGDRCALCLEDEPVAPVRISCQHLFCCGCAHTLFARLTHCPLCLQKPSPLRVSFPAQPTRPPKRRVYRHIKRLNIQYYGCLLLLGWSTILVYRPCIYGQYRSSAFDLYLLQVCLFMIFTLVLFTVTLRAYVRAVRAR